MASGLHLIRAWEELAEDPFRGLRAGPASFSPFTSAEGAPETPSGRHQPSKHPELPNTAEVCWVLTHTNHDTLSREKRILDFDSGGSRYRESRGTPGRPIDGAGVRKLRLGSAWRVP